MIPTEGNGRQIDECETSSQGGRTLSVTLCKWEKTQQNRKPPTQSTTLSVAKGKTHRHTYTCPLNI